MDSQRAAGWCEAVMTEAELVSEQPAERGLGRMTGAFWITERPDSDEPNGQLGQDGTPAVIGT